MRTGVSAEIPRRCGENGLGRPAASDLERIAFECFFMSVAPTLRGQNSDSMKRATVAFIYVGDAHASPLPLDPFDPSFCSPFAVLRITRASTINRETRVFIKTTHDHRLFAVSLVYNCSLQFFVRPVATFALGSKASAPSTPRLGNSDTSFLFAIPRPVGTRIRVKVLRRARISNYSVNKSLRLLRPAARFGKDAARLRWLVLVVHHWAAIPVYIEVTSCLISLATMSK